MSNLAKSNLNPVATIVSASEKNIPAGLRPAFNYIRFSRTSTLLLVFLLTLTIKDATAEPDKEDKRPVQYVAISFDGAKAIDIWKDTRALAQKHKAAFTYFVSCVYFLHYGNAKLYRAPGKSAGRSAIGFATSPQNISQRLDQLNGALKEGHEIASHACGHYNGSRWSKAAWQLEFERFSEIMKNAYRNNKLNGQPEDWDKIVDGKITGFRAPFMARNTALDQALAAGKFRYDASRGGYWHEKPSKSKSGLWDFRLAFIPEGPGKRLLLAMDYNFYVRHSSGRPKPASAGKFQRRMYDAYMGYFRKSYDGNRAPVQIGHHFSRWNGSAYWNALSQFVAEVCPRPDVRCVTYSQLAKALEAK